jgi:hypothetical protein
MFKIDNYEAPNAQVRGSILDAVTRTLVETDIQNGSALRVYELGWPTEAAQTWVIKQDGTYQNDLIFAAHYKVEFINGNFYPFTVNDVEFKKGQNTQDFEVTPYIRVKNPSITKEGNTIKATFSLEAGKPEVKVAAINLFAFTDIYVGNIVKFATSGGSQTFSPAATIDGTVYTLTIDLSNTTNANLFKYNRNYYFRIGALASVSGVGTVRYNYAPLVVIPL